MDQKKIGRFLKELRNEKGITQEQAANEFGVAQRTVSRWETGSNMPDLSILVELADFYDVDIREVINGERKSEIMEKDVKETLVMVSEYSDYEKKKKTNKLNILFAVGLFFILIGTACGQFDILYEVFKNNHISQGITGAVYGLGVGFEVIAFVFNNRETKYDKKM